MGAVRIRPFPSYAKQYVEQHNSMNGFSGDEPLPPNIIFEEVMRS